MGLTEDLATVKQQLGQTDGLYILLPQNPDQDSLAAALALYLGIKEQGKTVFVACATPMRVESSRLVGVDKISPKIGNRNLVISFDYIEDSLEKVSYHVEGDKFNLVVQPRSGKKPLDPKNVSFSYSGAEADLVIIIGATSFESLGKLYQDERKLFDKAQTVSLAKLPTPPFAQITLIDPEAGSVSEIAIQLLEALGVTINQDIASNLLAGIDSATNRFSNPNVKAATFGRAAQLLSQGARRQFMPVAQPVQFSLPNTPMPSGVAQPQQPVVPATPPPPPQDWLEPKIYSGASKV